VRCNDKGETYLSEEEIRNFILVQLGRRDLAIHSFEILGY